MTSDPSGSPTRLFATTFGVGYVAVGLVGFAMTGLDGFTSRNGPLVLGLFEVNPLHNLVHLLLGSALVVAGARSAADARMVTIVVGVAVGAVGLLGPLITSAGELALNGADNVLHLVTAVLAFLAVLAESRRDAGGRPAR
ncbi:MAG: DUF4383 domain-containing protein [Actinomycetes bacterium]